MTQDSKHNWFSVKDRLPETVGDYLVYWYIPDVNMAYPSIETFERGKFDCRVAGGSITHWRTLPDPPAALATCPALEAQKEKTDDAG